MRQPTQPPKQGPKEAPLQAGQAPKKEKTLFQKATAFGPDKGTGHPIGEFIAEAIKTTAPLAFGGGLGRGAVALREGTAIAGTVGKTAKTAGTFSRAEAIKDLTKFGRKFSADDVTSLMREVNFERAAAVGGIAEMAAKANSFIIARGATTPLITKAAQGKLISSITKETIKLGPGKIQVNTYTAGKAVSWLGKLGQSFTNNPIVGLAMVGSLITAAYGTISMKSWEVWGRAEASDSFTMAFREAEGNPELQADIKKFMDKLNDNDIWDTIIQWTPGLNVMVASEWKFLANEFLTEAIASGEELEKEGPPTQKQIKDWVSVLDGV